MHDEDDVPPLSTDAARFLRSHGETGAPTPDELLRVKTRLLAPPAPVAKILPLPTKPRRALVPPEVLAVAALVAFAMVAQLVYLSFRPEVVTGVVDDPQLGQIVTAYRTGGLQQARLAASSCTSAACASMSSKLLRALELSARFERLDDAEADELARLDVDLSGGVATDLTKALEDRRKKRALPPETAEEPAVDAQAAREWSQSRERVEARELYLRGYERKDSDPPGALAIFRQVVALTPTFDENHQKAKSRIAELEENQRPTAGDLELPTLTLTVGKSVEREYPPGLSRVAVGDAAVINVRSLGNNRLRISASGAGVTSLLVWKSDGTRVSQRIEVTR